MSCERRVKTFFETEEVKIECCNRNEIEALENNIICAIEQKLDKLNILIKNCDIYSNNSSLLVNDRYNICSNLIDVCTAFGMNIQKVDCSLKGKNYIISDSLLNVLRQLDKEYEFGKKISNKEVTETILEIINKNLSKEKIDSAILEMVRNIKKNGQYTTTRTRKIVEETEDDLLISRDVGKWVSNYDFVKNQLLEISKSINNTLKETNKYLRDGTAEIIYSRARQMGYSVEKVNKGKEIQLVLVRYE